jgi:serine/threonine protein phosphatase 1
MQTLVIGDIHGCFTELQALLDKSGLTEGDQIISLGDCVDRGPKTPEVLWFFRDGPNTRLLMGNHERKHVRGSRGEVKLARSQQISKIQFGTTYDDALAVMSGLPLYIDLPEALLVHGYFEPGIPVDLQNPVVLCGTGSGEHHLRQRYERPWYELYDGEKPIVVAHQNYTETDQPFVYRDRVWGLDTSCVTGKALTGLLLPAFRFVSVPSRANHWLETRKKYPETAPLVQPKREFASTQWDDESEKILADLLEKVEQGAQSILRDLQSASDYESLKPRQQTKRFAETVGQGTLSILLHLARTNQLNAERARPILRTPQNLNGVMQQIRERFFL